MFFFIEYCLFYPVYERLIHDLLHIIPRPPYQPETQSRDDSRDNMENVIFLSYTSDKLFYEANKQNEIIKWIYLEA
jgi:hypothetical protein